MRHHEDDQAWPTLSLMLMCVVVGYKGDDFGWGPTLGVTHHAAGAWRTLQLEYTLLTA